MNSTSTVTAGVFARDGVTATVGLIGLASLGVAAASRAEPIAAPATTWPVLVAMVAAVAFSMASIRSLGEGWPDLRRILVLIACVAAAYPGLWGLALVASAQAPHSAVAWATAVLAGVAHLPVIGAFSVVPLLSVRYIGPGSGRSALIGVIALGVAAAVSFALFFDDFDPLSASAPISSELGDRVGMTLNLAFLATVLLGPAVALRATWCSAADVAAARRLALVAGSSLAGTLLVMVCGALGSASGLGGVVVLVGMYAALALVVTGCVRSLATTPSAPPPVAATGAPDRRLAADEPETRTHRATPSSGVPPGPDTGTDHDPARAAVDSPTTGLATLTRRENEVLQLLADGLSNAGIAARLVLSERTVDAHLRSVFVKLDLPQGPEHNRRVQAVNAFRTGTAASPAAAPPTATSA